MNDINIMKKDIFQTLVKYQLSSFSQKLISPTDPSQFTLTYAVLSNFVYKGQMGSQKI